MSRDSAEEQFRFQMGQAVRWTKEPRRPYYIYQRRWWEREGLAPLVEYRFRDSKVPTATDWTTGLEWIGEAYLETWKEE